MMNLTKRVSTLDLCTTMKELGMPQGGSSWAWVKTGMEAWCLALRSETVAAERWIDAPTVAELGEMLPAGISDGDIYYWLTCGKGAHGWYCQYGIDSYDGTDPLHQAGASNEADARAKMLVYLLEKGLMTP